MNRNTYGLIIVVSLASLLLIISFGYLVTGQYGAINQTLFYPNQSIVFLYNISLNNTGLSIDSNISQVNVTLPSGFYFNGTTGTDMNGEFTNTTNVLSWTNLSGLVMNQSEGHFWFYANASIVGEYNITVTSMNNTDIETDKLIVRVIDITFPNISRVLANSISTSSATINWTSDIEVNSTLVYWENATNYTYLDDDYSLRNHSLNLNGLKSSTVYYYNITICDTFGSCTNSTRNNFTTLSYVNNTFSESVNEFSAGIYNITINNTDMDVASSITQINVTLPSGFYFNGTTGTDMNGEFTNTTNVLSWTNLSGLVMNQSEGHFWFYANATVHSIQNLTILVTNSYGIGSSILSRLINDKTPPGISSVSADPDSDSATITWTTNESSNSRVYYRLTSSGDNDTEESSTMVTSHSIVISGLDSETTYYYNVRSEDSGGNIAYSSQRSFATDAADTTTDTGDSADDDEPTTSFWKNDISYSDKELRDKNNASFALALGDRIKVKIDGKTHYIGMIRVRSSSVTINVTSEPQQATIKLAESKDFEVTGDGYFDIRLKLENLINTTHANISVKYLHLPINYSSASYNSTDTNNLNENAIINQTDLGDDDENIGISFASKIFKPWTFITFGIIIVICLVVVIIWHFINKKHKHLTVKRNVKVKHP